MKKTIWIFILFLTGALIISCNKSDIQYENDFEKSFKAWISFKESSNNSYSYKVVNGSGMGISWQKTTTTITVTNGKVTQRQFRYAGAEEWLEEIRNEAEWTENEDEINSHPQSSAAEAITLDEVYEKAKNDWLIKRKNAKIYFENKNSGMISTCGYVEDSCQDGCFTGITIEEIEALQCIDCANKYPQL